MKGQSAAAPPTAAAAPVATNKKSRRVGWSAEDAVVTIPTLSSYAAGGTAPGGAQGPRNRLPAPAAPRGGRTSRVPAKTRRKQQSKSFYWHPCRTSASPLTARKRAMHEFRGRRCFIETFPARNQPVTAHADRTFPTRHPPEHRHDSPPLRLSGHRPPTSSNRPASRSPTGISAGREWITSTMSALTRHNSWSKFEEWRAAQQLPAAAVHHQGRHGLPRFPLPDVGHPAIRARERRRHRRGGRGRGCAAGDPDQPGAALAQCRHDRGDGRRRSAAAGPEPARLIV